MNTFQFKLKLTPEQKKHEKSLLWLQQGPRNSGRSFLLAYTTIRAVLDTGKECRIIDHDANRESDMFLAYRIRDIVTENNLPLEVKKGMGNREFILKTKNI